MNKIVRFFVSSLFFFIVAPSVFAGIEIASVSSAGEQGNGRSEISSISADGRFVAFSSQASNLVTDDTNGEIDVFKGRDIFVRDRETGIIERVSLSSAGDQANNISESPSISANGRFVAFTSLATNLVTGDTNGDRDVFVHDRETGITNRVSVSSAGVQGNGGSFVPAISADGRFVAFSSGATNLVADDTNNAPDVFVFDQVTGITERVSLSSAGDQANAVSDFPSISADGRFVAFASDASSLVADDTNNTPDIFVHDRDAGITERVTLSSAGEQANAVSGFPSISADGRFVAFTSLANSLVDSDTNGDRDVFVHDREQGITERVSVSSSGSEGDSASRTSSRNYQISADGRFVVFKSEATNLVAGDTNGQVDIFVHDRATGVTERMNVSSAGAQTNDVSDFPSISADGRFVTFHSWAWNLVASDTNQTQDVFVTNNPLADSNTDLSVEKLINNEARNTPDTAAQLIAGPVFATAYKVTNNSSQGLTQVQVFENGELVCDVYNLAPGQTKQRWRCNAIENALVGDQQSLVTVVAKVNASGTVVTSSSRSYYTGHETVTGELKVTHYVDNRNADQQNQAQELADRQARILFKVENTTNIELYRVKTYHDPVTPVNSGWDEQCNLGSLKPGQVRYCGRDITLTQAGLHKAFGRAQARIGNFGPIFGPSDVINASNPTYFIVP